jgi:hypothetical protein
MSNHPQHSSAADYSGAPHAVLFHSRLAVISSNFNFVVIKFILPMLEVSKHQPAIIVNMPIATLLHYNNYNKNYYQFPIFDLIYKVNPVFSFN